MTLLDALSLHLFEVAYCTKIDVNTFIEILENLQIMLFIILAFFYFLTTKPGKKFLEAVDDYY
jgi:hypothetical protein